MDFYPEKSSGFEIGLLTATIFREVFSEPDAKLSPEGTGAAHFFCALFSQSLIFSLGMV